MSHPLRKLSASQVRELRDAYSMRKHAAAMKRIAALTFRTVPNLKDHAKRMGISECQAGRIVKGIVYKEVR